MKTNYFLIRKRCDFFYMCLRPCIKKGQAGWVSSCLTFFDTKILAPFLVYSVNSLRVLVIFVLFYGLIHREDKAHACHGSDSYQSVQEESHQSAS